VILFVDSWKLQPGTYSGIIDIRPYEGTNSFPVKTVKLNISVMPVDLKNDHLHLIVWELDNSVPEPGKIRERMLRMDEFEIGRELWPEYVRDMAAHRVNPFHLSAGRVPSPTFEGRGGGALRKIKAPLNPAALPAFDYELAQYKRYWKEGMILSVGAYYPVAIRDGMISKGMKIFTPELRENLAIYFKALIAHLKSRGFSEDDFALYFDELSGQIKADPEYAGIICEPLKILKEVNPKVKTIVTQSPEEWFPYIDIHGPYISQLTPEWLEILKKTKKPVWSYANRGYSDQKGSPLNIEKYGWLAWSKDLQGIGSWAYNYWIADSWDDFDNFSADPKFNKRSAEAYVYWGPKGPITSRRWEALREAMEDHELLYCLKVAIDMAQEKKADVAQSRQLLEQAVRKVLDSEDPGVVSEYKAKILKEIGRIQ
jgi:hypothetical protein